MTHAQHPPIASLDRGAALRAVILDALRPTVEAETGGPVRFVVGTINVMGEWAYVDAKPQRPDGAAIDWRATKFRQAFEADAFSGIVLALLKRNENRWEVAGYFIGPTDVAWYEWIEKFKLPEAFFLASKSH
ncbi:MAG: hypothetical protein AB7O50_10020 [Pseudolabrys sp.]